MAKRRFQPLMWADFRAYLMATFTHTRDKEEIERRTGRPTSEINDGALRGYLMDHPKWGITSRPDVWWKLRKHIYLPRNQSEPWGINVVLANAELIKQTLGDPRRNRAGVTAFMNLWGPRGPLTIPRAEWIKDAGFRKWLDTRRNR